MNLRDYIHGGKIKQVDIANSASCTPAMVSQIIAGKRRPSPDVAKRISEATGGKVSILELLYPDQDLGDSAAA